MPDKFDSVCVVGLGYIGLPTAATFAAVAGIETKGIDIRPHIVDELNEGRAHFSEPDLDALVKSAVESGKLRAYTEPQTADAFVMAVPTPMQADNSPDMTYVRSAAKAIAPVLVEGNLVILESTSPLGATKMMAEIIRSERPDLVDGEALKVSLAYCPERILPGQMVRELVENDRIVGGIYEGDAERARDLYTTFVKGEVLLTGAETAELVKLIENAYRDVNIAFANEVANICESRGLDAWEAISLANHHPRVNILNPGPGVGGHCIAIDPWFLITQNPTLSGLMAEARSVNDGRPETVMARIRAASEKTGSKKVACLGLAFKPDVDDLRESPAVKITAQLADEGFNVAAVEPHVDALPKQLEGKDNASLTPLDTALEQSDIIVVLVAHSAFKDGASQASGKTVIDTVGLWR